MPIFLSYARQNEQVVKQLVGGLEVTGKPVWFDLDLTGGDVWWDKILDKIRACTVFVFGLSDDSLHSKACLAEYYYAAALGKPIVPVQVGPGETQLANPLARFQIVAYRPDDAVTGFEVVAAVVAAEERAGALPDILPPEPQIPHVYLRALAAQIDMDELSQSDQLGVIEQLRKALRDEDAQKIRQQILDMLRNLQAKPWITRLADREIRNVFLVEDPAPEKQSNGSAGAKKIDQAKPPPSIRPPALSARPRTTHPGRAVTPLYKHPASGGANGSASAGTATARGYLGSGGAESGRTAVSVTDRPSLPDDHDHSTEPGTEADPHAETRRPVDAPGSTSHAGRRLQPHLAAAAVILALITTMSAVFPPPSIAGVPTATSIALPSTTAATPSPALKPAVTEAIFTGRSSGNELTLAVGVKDGRAAGYICDGKKVEAWLEGEIAEDHVTLHGRDASTGVTATVNQQTLLGTVTAGGTTLPFSAQLATGQAGLYQSRRVINGITTRIGWIVLPDGTQVGIRNTDGVRTPAPPLNPVTTQVQDGGQTIQAERVSGTTAVIGK